MNGTDAKIFFSSATTARRVVDVGAVDFRQQGREHRRSRRHFDHLYHCAVRQLQGLKPFAQIERDGVAGATDDRSAGQD